MPGIPQAVEGPRAWRTLSVPAQIAVLLALTAELFDQVPLDQMTLAEQAVRDAAADVPSDVRERFNAAEN